MNLDQIINSYKTLPGSIGEYVPDQCPACEVAGRIHYVLCCRICEAPPAGDGKCACDWGNVGELIDGF